MTTRLPRAILATTLLLALLATNLLNALPARAADFTVSTLADSGAGSLRQAILDAGTAPGPDNITISVNGTISLASPLVINQDVTVTGPGAANLTINASAGNFRALTINGGTVAISGVTITKGREYNGGNIHIEGSSTVAISDSVVSASRLTDGIYVTNSVLTVSNTTITGNLASGLAAVDSSTVVIANSTIDANRGTGVYVADSNITINGATISANENRGMELDHSIANIEKITISGNSAYEGGGLYVQDNSTLTMTESTITGNRASSFRGGGAYIRNSTATMVNTTISGNSANVEGGGLLIDYGGSSSVVNLRFVTITGNVADFDNDGSGSDGGILRYSGLVNIQNSIILGNIDRGAPGSSDCAGALTSQGNNIFGTDEDCPTGGSDQNIADVNTVLNTTLNDNGGPTKTHALVGGSPAANAGSITCAGGCPMTDQRGIARPQGGRNDIGAYESGAVLPPLPQGYGATDLGTLGGPTSFARGLTNAGQVFGGSDTSDGNRRAFLAPRPGEVSTGLRDLGTLGGALSEAFGANNQGQVVGEAAGADGRLRAFLFKDGRMDPIAAASAFNTSRANAINDAGDIAGVGDDKAFAIRSGTQQIIDLNALGGFSTSRATALNNAGQVGGEGMVGGKRRAFVYDGQSFANLAPLSVYDQSAVTALNDTGLVVGEGDGRGFVLDRLQNTLVDLNTRGGFAASVATGINDAGQVLGIGDNQPFVYDPKTNTLKLLADLLQGDLPFDNQGGGINDNALVAVNGFVSGQRHAQLLTVNAGQVLLDLAVGPGGQVTANPPGTSFAANTMVTLNATPLGGQVFLGWRIDGQPGGWDPSLDLKMDGSHVVEATFAAQPAFPDVTPATTGATEAIAELAARGIIRGYADGTFGPGDPILRAQMAALIARAVGWDAEAHASAFPDQGEVDEALWRNVGTLAFYNVARGYSDGTYNPTGEVLYAQVISFITRAMVAKGYWEFQPDDGSVYPNVPQESGHRVDLATYVHYAGLVRGTTSAGEALPAWDQPATRAWFAFALWQALDAQFGQP